MNSHSRKSLGDERGRAQEVYRQAARVFYEKGFAATSMDDLARAVRMTKAGLYYYIKDKEDLYFRIIDYGLDWMQTGVIEPARAEPDAERRLNLIVRLHALELLESEHDIPILTDEVAALSPKHIQRIRQRKRVYFDLVRGTLEALKAQGKLRDVDTTVATFSLFGMLLWLPRWYKKPGRLSSEQLLEHLTRIVRGSFLNDAP
jgi:AcrR family transcriptional regulator